MGREYLKPGFSLDDVYKAMTVADATDRLYEPELYNAAGIKYKSLREAREAIKKGKAVVAVEHSRNGITNIVYCANGSDGKLAISPSKNVEHDFPEVLEKVNKRPSLRRRIACTFSRHKEKYIDVVEYRNCKGVVNNEIKYGIQADWKLHSTDMPVSSIQTMEHLGDEQYEKISKVTEQLREKYKDQIPGIAPFETGFEDSSILSDPQALKIHAKKRQLVAAQNQANRDYESAYPGIDTSHLTEVQETALNIGLQRKVGMYGILAEQEPASEWDGCTRAIAEIAAAQYMHVMLYRAQKDPNCKEAENLKLFNTRKDLEKFISVIQENVFEVVQLTGDIQLWLETGESSRKLLKYAETAMETVRREKAAEVEAKPEEPAPQTPTAQAAATPQAPTAPAAATPQTPTAQAAATPQAPTAPAAPQVPKAPTIPFMSTDKDAPQFDDGDFTGSTETLIENSHVAMNAMKEIMEKANGGPVEFSPQLFADFMLGRSLEESSQLRNTPGGGKFKEIFEYLNEPDNADAMQLLITEKFGGRPLNETELSKYVGAGDNSKMFNFIESAIQENKTKAQEALNASKASVKKFEQVLQTGKKPVAPQQEVAPQVDANKPVL